MKGTNLTYDIGQERWMFTVWGEEHRHVVSFRAASSLIIFPEINLARALEAAGRLTFARWLAQTGRISG